MSATRLATQVVLAGASRATRGGQEHSDIEEAKRTCSFLYAEVKIGVSLAVRFCRTGEPADVRADWLEFQFKMLAQAHARAQKAFDIAATDLIAGGEIFEDGVFASCAHKAVLTIAGSVNGTIDAILLAAAAVQPNASLNPRSLLRDNIDAFAELYSMLDPLDKFPPVDRMLACLEKESCHAAIARSLRMVTGGSTCHSTPYESSEAPPLVPPTDFGQSISTAQVDGLVEPPRHDPRYVFRRVNRFSWEWRFSGGKTHFLKSQVGADYLHILLEAPGKLLGDSELAGLVARKTQACVKKISNDVRDQLTSGGLRLELDGGMELIDDEGLRSYMQRLDEINCDIEEARQGNDQARLERLQDEKHQILEQLEPVLGKKKKSRRIGDEAKKVKDRVRIAIKRVIREIGDDDTLFASHLTSSLSFESTIGYIPQVGICWST